MGGHLVEVKVWGRYACFTRPEFKVERVSYPILTPSAAVGVLEAIYWKPQFRWRVTEIWALEHPSAPPGQQHFQSYYPITLNEVAVPGDSHPAEYVCERDRVQRSCLVLRWPCYRIRARAEIFTSTTNPDAIKRQFTERVEDGQCFHQPYLGLRQFAACFAPTEQGDKCLPVTGDFGPVLHSAVRLVGSERVEYRFTPCVLREGKWAVTAPEVTR